MFTYATVDSAVIVFIFCLVIFSSFYDVMSTSPFLVLLLRLRLTRRKSCIEMQSDSSGGFNSVSETNIASLGVVGIRVSYERFLK